MKSLSDMAGHPITRVFMTKKTMNNGECRLKYLNDDRGPDITFQSNHTKISTILPSINYLWGTTTSVGTPDTLLSCETPEVR